MKLPLFLDQVIYPINLSGEYCYGPTTAAAARVGEKGRRTVGEKIIRRVGEKEISRVGDIKETSREEE